MTGKQQVYLQLKRKYLNKTKEVMIVNIKYVGKNGNKADSGKVHVYNGDRTGCGEIISDNRDEWQETSEAVTCDRNGCREH